MYAIRSYYDDRHRGVPEIVWQIEPEPIVIDENCVQWLVEEFFRYSPFEFIESQIQELELRELQNHLRELTGEAIVTNIQLEQKLQVLEVVRNCAAEPVGVYVEQCKINEQAQLLRQVPGNVTVVEINARNGPDLVVVGCRGAEYPSIVSYNFV